MESGLQVLPVFIFDANILQELKSGDTRVNFIHQQLLQINQQLQLHGSSMLCKQDKPVEVWQEIVDTFEVHAVFYNKDYEPYALERDREITDLLTKNQIEMFAFKDQVIFEEDEVVKEDGLPYTVFTPYKNKWLSRFNQSITLTFKEINYKLFYQCNLEILSLATLGFEFVQLHIRDYDLSRIGKYAVNRDFPALDATSYLCVHLHFGTLSIRRIMAQVGNANPDFRNELIWREFFMQILFYFPYSVNRNFKSKYDGIQWRNRLDEF